MNIAKIFLIALQALAAGLVNVPGIEGEAASAFLDVQAAVSGAIAAHNKAAQVVDPSLLVPETPVT